MISLDETNAISRRLPAFALGVLVAVVWAGCGSSGSKTTSAAGAGTAGAPGATTSSPSAQTGGSETSATGSSASAQSATKVDATVRANAICARRNSELKATIPAHASLPKIVASAAGRAAIERRALGELNGLAPPAHMSGAWRAAIAAIETELHGTLALAKYAGASDSASLRREKALLDKPQLRLLVAASHAGLKQCGVVAGPSVLGL